MTISYIEPKRKIQYLAKKGQVFQHKTKNMRVEVVADTPCYCNAATKVRYLTEVSASTHSTVKYGMKTGIKTAAIKIGETRTIVLMVNLWLPVQP